MEFKTLFMMIWLPNVRLRKSCLSKKLSFLHVRLWFGDRYRWWPLPPICQLLPSMKHGKIQETSTCLKIPALWPKLPNWWSKRRLKMSGLYVECLLKVGRLESPYLPIFLLVRLGNHLNWGRPHKNKSEDKQVQDHFMPSVLWSKAAWNWTVGLIKLALAWVWASLLDKLSELSKLNVWLSPTGFDDPSSSVSFRFFKHCIAPH